MLVLRTFMIDLESIEILDKLKEILPAKSRSEVLRCIIHDYADLVKQAQDDSPTAP